MRFRRHHNNIGLRQIKRGKTQLWAERMERTLGIVKGENVMHKSWYQLQAREANQANFYNYDTPIPICNTGAFGEALRRYRESEAKAPDTEWRLVVISETVIISNGQAA